MKKVFLLMLGVLAFPVAMQAQSEAGTFSIIPRVGLNFANMTNNEVFLTYSDQLGVDQTLKSRVKTGVSIGADIEYQATEQGFVTMGLHYSRQGSRYPDFERTATDGFVEGYNDWHTDLDYLNLPLLVGCRVAGGFSVKAGIQLGMLLNAKMKLTETDIRISEGSGRQQGDAVSRTDDFRSDCRKVDIALPLGVSYELENVIIDARYNFGLSRIYNIDAVKSRNSVIQLSVGYRLRL